MDELEMDSLCEKKRGAGVPRAVEAAVGETRSLEERREARLVQVR
jgi:hypothetical protein